MLEKKRTQARERKRRQREKQRERDDVKKINAKRREEYARQKLLETEEKTKERLLKNRISQWMCREKEEPWKREERLFKDRKRHQKRRSKKSQVEVNQSITDNHDSVASKDEEFIDAEDPEKFILKN
uniref:CSON004933 protein n=1 Tax=Culicoides sonorensis TaxID=179676 RepID=A0A336M6G3_CULSO